MFGKQITYELKMKLLGKIENILAEWHIKKFLHCGTQNYVDDRKWQKVKRN